MVVRKNDANVVLLGVSGAPLSQYNFYSYLRGYWQAEANLNFWLDVATHENLWAMWLENQQRKKEQEAQYQYYYESEKASQQTRDNKVEDDGEEFEEQKEESFNQFQRSYAHDDSHSSSGNTVTEFDDSRNPVSSLSNNSSGITEQEASVRQQTYKRPISEEDLHKSAKQIYRKYAHLNLIPEENRITMHDLILRQGRHNPVVFASAKAYVYHIMNAIYFPKFVEASIDKNLTRIHSIIALPLGMIALTCGIALELYYIFMALENRVFRLWGLIPVWIGWVLLQTALTSFLPPLSFFGVSEHKLFRFHKIREKSILHAHRSRALRFIFYDTLVTILSVGLLLAIPPIRLDSPE
ncbi:hypothetical protein G9A89_011209 [Geosiphon pyriformis]|nr:hypothetical protein G9A89_011209 [Geosiphon pyriformis]